MDKHLTNTQLLNKRIAFMNQSSLALLITSLLVTNVSCKQPKQKPYVTGMESRPLPAFNLLLPDSVTYLNTKEIKSSKPIILFYYSTSCQFCRAQMREMLNHMDRYKDNVLIVTTNEDFKSMRLFIDYFNLDKYENVIAGLDTSNTIETTFRVIGVPFTAVFSNNKKLTAAYVGRLRGEALWNATKVQ
jgi:thiol-disulfide isomerase/thioredoxin